MAIQAGYDGRIGTEWRMLGMLLLTVALMVAPGIVHTAEAVGFGYNLGPGQLEMASESPGQSFRFSPILSIPQKIRSGSLRMGLGASWANIWAKEPRYELDYEIVHSRLSVSYGISRRLLFTAALEKRAYIGGAMDGFLIGFHNLFGLEQGGRDKAPRNQTHLIIYDAGGRVLVNLDDFGIYDNDNIQAGVSYILSPGNRYLPAVSVSGALCLNFDTPLSGHGEPLDAAAGIGLSKRWAAKWFTYHNLTFIRFGKHQVPYLSLNRSGFAFINGVAWQWRPRVSWFMQFLYTDGQIKGVPGLNDSSYEAHIGLKWQTRHWGRLEFAIIENVISYDSSPDFGVHLGYSYVLK